jgi:hypothetical protein
MSNVDSNGFNIKISLFEEINDVFIFSSLTFYFCRMQHLNFINHFKSEVLRTKTTILVDI